MNGGLFVDGVFALGLQSFVSFIVFYSIIRFSLNILAFVGTHPRCVRCETEGLSELFLEEFSGVTCRA